MRKLIQPGKYQFRNNYYADSSGHIWSEYKKGYLREYDDKNGYKKVVLMTTDRPPSKGHRFSVHRLILSTLNPVENMRELTVDHIDGDITNNKLENLRWATMQENLANPNTRPNRRVYDQDGTHNASASFNSDSILQIVQDINSGNYTRKQILEKYQICRETLTNVIQKKHYKKELENIDITPQFISDMERDTRGEKNGRAKLKEEEVLFIIKLWKSGEYSNKEIARMFKVTRTTIGDIVNGKTWKHLTKDIL